MSRLALLTCLVGGLALLAPAAPRDPDEETTIDPASGIHRTSLENGLEVLVLPRRAAPTVAVQIWFRVGSADEREGERGIAHFLEHLLFKGTKSLPKGEIDALTHRNGGRNNAFTSQDVTVYHFTFAPDRWTTALRIEADRMRNTIFDPEEFESERRVVLEELKQGLDEPWDMIDDEVIAAAFRVHPYHHPVIGYVPDLERVSRETVRAFYLRHYTPSNATVVVVGGVDAATAIQAVREAFGGVEGPSAPERRRTPEPPQRGERRIVSRNATTTLERFEVVWHTVAANHADDRALDVARAILSLGRSSRLHERLVETEGLCTGVTTSNDTRVDPGLFWVWGELTEGADATRVEAIVGEEVERLKDPANLRVAEVAKAKKQVEAALVFGRETSDGAAEEIGWLRTGDSWRRFGSRLEELRAVTAEDVARVAKAHLRRENRTWGLGTGAREAPKRNEDEGSAGTPVALSPRRIVLPNGLVLLVQPKTEAPVAAVRAHVRAGRMVEAKPGVAHLAGDLLLAGAGGRTREEIAETIESVGGRMASSSQGVTARVLAGDLPLALELVAASLRQPAFPEDELARARDRIVSELAAEKDEPQKIARNRFRRLAYGADHPLGRHEKGDPESVRALTRNDVETHHAAWFHPNNTALVVVGDVDPVEVERLVREQLGDWKRGEQAPGTSPDVSLPEKEIHDRIEREGQQVNVYLGHAGIRRRHPDYVPLVVLDNILGWSPVFSDRLSRELRENRGLCYDTWASSTRGAGTQVGLFTAFVGTSPETADEAIAAMKAEITRIRGEPVTEEEIAAARSYLTGSWVFRYETAEQIAERLVELEVWDVGFDWPARFVEATRSVTREDVLRVAKAHLHPDRLVVVEVGPKR